MGQRLLQRLLIQTGFWLINCFHPAFVNAKVEKTYRRYDGMSWPCLCGVAKICKGPFNLQLKNCQFNSCKTPVEPNHFISESTFNRSSYFISLPWHWPLLTMKMVCIKSNCPLICCQNLHENSGWRWINAALSSGQVSRCPAVWRDLSAYDSLSFTVVRLPIVAKGPVTIMGQR